MPTSCCGVDDPDRPSTWGPYHYEVADTKLARHVKASAVLQICSYVDQLEAIQGVRPEWLYVALGGSARTVERLRVDDYMAYYRSVRDRFMATMADETPAAYPPIDTYPEPVEHCDVCRWAAECVQRRRADDHLSLVAGITARQRRALQERDVATLEALGDAPLPLVPPLEGTSAAGLRARPRAGATPARGAPDEHRPLRAAAARGQATEPEAGTRSRLAPAPSPGDLFFDIEGDPYALDDGLDYLFGVLEVDGTFHAFWSRDEDGEFTLEAERRAFERLMDFFAERRAADPNLHIYHYAPYEPTALKRLMGRYGTREDEVDDLLREGVLVDLLRAVRQGLRASVESYSIKRMETFYGFERSDRPPRCRQQHRRVRAVARAGRGRAPGRRPPRADRALQRGRRRQQPPAARLARDPQGRAGRARRRRCSATRTTGCRGDRRAERRAAAGPGPRRSAGRPGRPSRSTRSTAAPSSRRPGSWPSCWAGIGARRRPCGGSSIG